MSDWKRVEELFTQALELDAAARQQLFDECDVRGELRSRVEALIDAAQRENPRLNATAMDLLRELAEPADPEELCGQVCGSYRIDAHLSSGGMGHVYRATHIRAEVERPVALKALRPGLATEALLVRFQRERLTLAALEHEGIVRYLDSGALPDGRPYVVTELVEGVPLSEWDPGRSFGVKERVRLLLRILAAVQYAHNQLVVHRDLKPSNVLVDEAGRPKLLDFGIAALIGEEVPGSTPLTPTHASPEQLRGEPVTCASDVYSLGVLAHEFLTARPPVSVPGSTGYMNSTFQPASGSAPDARAARTLAGDLDAILARALASDPDLRYASADAFADDLSRWLEHLPPAARPGGPRVRMLRALRRHPWPAAALLLTCSALVTGWIASDLARRQAAANATRGWGAHAQAQRAAALFEDWILSTTEGDPVLRIDAIAGIEARLEHDFTTCAETEALVRLALGRLYLQGKQAEEAYEQAERVLALDRERGLSSYEVEQAHELQRARALD